MPVKLFSIVLWVSISLLAAFLSSSHPWGAIAIGGMGGAGLGVFLWRRASRLPMVPASTSPASNFVSRVYRHEALLLAPSLLLLLFANRLPAALLFVALLWLLLVWSGRKAARRPLLPGTSLDLPVIFLLLSALFSLYATVDLRRSADAVCILVADMAFGWTLIYSLDTERKIHLAFSLFLTLGVGVALSAFLVMEFPPFSKLTPITALYPYFPTLFPRKVHPNYLGGMLAFFLPSALWSLVFGYRRRIWACAAAGLIGVGLLVTQCRSVLLATGMVFLVRTYQIRWVRWGGIILALACIALVKVFGIDIFLDSATGLGFEPRLEFREEVWKRAVFIARDFPFTGIGLRSFPQVVDHHYTLYDLNLNTPLQAQAHAHNLYLETAAALGFPGLVAFCAVLGVWGGMMGEVLAKSHRNPVLRSAEILGTGMAGGMVAHLLYGITDAISLGEKAGLVFWAILGLTAALWRRVRLSGDPGEDPTPVGSPR